MKKPSYDSVIKRAKKRGFTLVEMIIIIVILAVIATIVTLSYNAYQAKAQNIRRQFDIKSVESKLQKYFNQNGVYPATTPSSVANWKTVDVRTDANCFNGSAQTDWVPDVTLLPQSIPNNGNTAGVGGSVGCYLYASDGEFYVLSAWNMVSTPHTNPDYYRRLGFRTFQTASSTQFYTCNDNVTGGVNGNSYTISQDYYKHSYTVSNITDCDETPPAGA